jgi:hypothetical protein
MAAALEAECGVWKESPACAAEAIDPEGQEESAPEKWSFFLQIDSGVEMWLAVQRS